MLGQNGQGIGKKSVMKTLGQDGKAEEGGGSMGSSLWRLAYLLSEGVSCKKLSLTEVNRNGTVIN